MVITKEWVYRNRNYTMKKTSALGTYTINGFQINDSEIWDYCMSYHTEHKKCMDARRAAEKFVSANINEIARITGLTPKRVLEERNRAAKYFAKRKE